MKRLAGSLLLLLSFCLGSIPEALADMVVVVNARSGVETLDRNEAINIFMGRYRQLPSGIAAQPFDLLDSQPEKARFYALLVGKTLAEINAYWARLLFSGRTQAPRQASNPADMLDMIASEKGGIGYLPRSKIDSRVKVVLELD